MSTGYNLKKIALNITLKTPLVSFALAFITILLLYIVASQMKVGIYESMTGEIKYSDGNAVIEVIASGQTVNKNIIDSLFYETSYGIRYSCKYSSKEKTADLYMLKFTVNDAKFPINAREVHQVYVDIKTGNITLAEKLLFNRGK